MNMGTGPEPNPKGTPSGANENYGADEEEIKQKS